MTLNQIKKLALKKYPDYKDIKNIYNAADNYDKREGFINGFVAALELSKIKNKPKVKTNEKN